MTARKIIVFLLVPTFLLTLFVAAFMRHQLKQGRKTPPPAGHAALAVGASEASQLPRGFVVWSSNRHGNHDILMMELPERRITRLTEHPHTEYFPRISPDGRWLVFSRSHQPWVSQRNQGPWDVILLDLKRGKERLLAKNGNTPTWSADGKYVYFQRNIRQFIEHEVKTGKERVVFESGRGKIKPESGLQTPHLSPGRDYVAVTLRHKQHLMGIVDLAGNLTRISDGCQLTWSKRGDFLYYIDYGGRMKNALYIYDPATGKSRQWLDMPGEHSHEYFPKLSNDERFLVLGSSSGGHEHDSADYEIFLWRVDAPADSATRLTFHTGNDNWPDVYLYQ